MSLVTSKPPITMTDGGAGIADTTASSAGPMKAAPREGVKFYSLLDGSGYCVAGIAYVRALVNAGVPVHWIPLGNYGGVLKPVSWNVGSVSHALLSNNVGLSDLQALLAATARPIHHAAVVVQLTPEDWRGFFEPGRRNIGYTTWEANALPPHWVPLLNQADAVCVPSNQDLKTFRAGGIVPPVHVVPHIRRHSWFESLPSTLAAVRASLGIPDTHFVFYSINTWNPRKNLPLLLRAFFHAFQADEPVSLVIKTGAMGYGPPPYYADRPTAELAQAVMEAAAAELGRALPSVCLLPYELTGNAIDQLHELGDCYVSLTHGEGWGLGAFEAATRGTPVVMTGWGGQLDFLGTQWPGAVPYRLTPAPVWPPSSPSFWPSQRWAAVDFDAAKHALREAFDQPNKGQRAAQRIQSSISDQFCEAVVTQQLLQVIYG